MKLSFKPFPGLTIVTLIMLTILIWLGTWQYQRLQWKTGILADVEASVTAEPFTSLHEVTEAIEANKPIDFRRIQVEVQTLEFDKPFRFYWDENRDVSWRLYSPIRQGDVTAFKAGPVIVDKAALPAAIRAEDVLSGYVRAARIENNRKVKSTPEKNRWFGFNPLPETHNWADQVPGGADMRFYIDVVEDATDANLLPPRRPNIRNNHFDYMLTWYGLAIVLLIIYAILHMREGRLKWR